MLGVEIQFPPFLSRKWRRGGECSQFWHLTFNSCCECLPRSFDGWRRVNCSLFSLGISDVWEQKEFVVWFIQEVLHIYIYGVWRCVQCFGLSVSLRDESLGEPWDGFWLWWFSETVFFGMFVGKHQISQRRVSVFWMILFAVFIHYRFVIRFVHQSSS